MQDEKYERLFGRLRSQKKDESKNSKNMEGIANLDKDEHLSAKQVTNAKKSGKKGMDSLKEEEKSLLKNAEGDSMFSLNKRQQTKSKAKNYQDDNSGKGAGTSSKELNIDIFKDYERLPKPQT